MTDTTELRRIRLSNIPQQKKRVRAPQARQPRPEPLPQAQLLEHCAGLDNFRQFITGLPAGSLLAACIPTAIDNDVADNSTTLDENIELRNRLAAFLMGLPDDIASGPDKVTECEKLSAPTPRLIILSHDPTNAANCRNSMMAHPSNLPANPESINLRDFLASKEVSTQPGEVFMQSRQLVNLPRTLRNLRELCPNMRITIFLERPSHQSPSIIEGIDAAARDNHIIITRVKAPWHQQSPEPYAAGNRGQGRVRRQAEGTIRDRERAAALRALNESGEEPTSKGRTR